MKHAHISNTLTKMQKKTKTFLFCLKSLNSSYISLSSQTSYTYTVYMVGNFHRRNFHELGFRRENFHGLLAGASKKKPHPKILTFMNSHKTLKFVVVFSLDSFPVYGIPFVSLLAATEMYVVVEIQ